MLSREIMGIACLGVVWVTALLVAGAAWQDLRDLLAIAKRARDAIVGVVTGGDLAEWRVEQTGRALDAHGDDQAIGFHDRGFASEILGGRVRVDGSADDEVEIAPAKGQVWIREGARRDAVGCASVADFDAAYAQARKAKGLHREARVRVRDGERVWIVGAREGSRVVPVIVATLDPAAFCRRKALGLAAFIPLELVACAAATRLALSVPHFGRASVAGAIACMAFFLGVTPLAVSLREGARRPHEAFLRNRWSRDALARRGAESHEILGTSPTE
jgi:hypothetical protein